MTTKETKLIMPTKFDNLSTLRMVLQERNSIMFFQTPAPVLVRQTAHDPHAFEYQQSDYSLSSESSNFTYLLTPTHQAVLSEEIHSKFKL